MILVVWRRGLSGYWEGFRWFNAKVLRCFVFGAEMISRWWMGEIATHPSPIIVMDSLL